MIGSDGWNPKNGSYQMFEMVGGLIVGITVGLCLLKFRGIIGNDRSEATALRLFPSDKENPYKL